MNAEVSSGRNALAPYGRACTNCARAKAKCVVGDNSIDSKCERCSRLKKDCQTPEAIRKRRPPNRSSAGESARLERKLDGLYSLLGSVVPPTGISGSSDSASTWTKTSNPSPRSNISSQEPHNARGPEPSSFYHTNHPSYSQPQVLTPAASNGSTSTPAPSSGDLFSSIQEPSEQEADELLKFFRDGMLSFMPFITITPSTTASELRLDRPFFWLCIMAITSKSSIQQTALDHAVRSNLGRLMLVEGEKSLDLLLGLMTCIAWGQYQLHTKPITSNLVQLAIGLLAELGIDGTVRKEMPHLLLTYNAQGCPEKLGQRQERTLEERRAAVGCFVVISVVSNYFAKVDPLPWSTYLDECTEILLSSQETSNDCLLSHIARLQAIDTKVCQLPNLPRVCDSVRPTKAPWQFYTKTFQSELLGCKTSIPSTLLENKLLLLHLHNTEAKIHETAFSYQIENPDSIDIPRVESLCAILEATQQWYDIYFTIPPAYYVRFPCSITTQLSQGMVMLYRLATFDHPGWNRDLVKQTCNLTEVMTKIIENMSQVKAAAGPGYDDESWQIKQYEQTVKKLTFIKIWWQAKEKQEAPPSQPAVADTEEMTSLSTDFLSDAWFNDMLMADNFLLDPCGLGDNSALNSSL